MFFLLRRTTDYGSPRWIMLYTILPPVKQLLVPCLSLLAAQLFAVVRLVASCNFYALEVGVRLGVEANGGFLRLGLVHYNTPEEVERTLVALDGVR